MLFSQPLAGGLLLRQQKGLCLGVPALPQVSDTETLPQTGGERVRLPEDTPARIQRGAEHVNGPIVSAPAQEGAEIVPSAAELYSRPHKHL